MHLFCEECLGKINAKDVELFQNGSVQELYRLKALIALEQVNTWWSKKRRIFYNEQNFDRLVRLTGWVL